MSGREQQRLENAKSYLGQAKTLLNKATDAKDYERVAVGVTLAYRQIEPITPYSTDVIAFEDSLVKVGYTPGANTSRIDRWVALTSEVWTRERVARQVSFVSKLLEQPEPV